MTKQAPEIIKEYEVLFAVRTGVTILVPHSGVFDCGIEIPVCFHVSPSSPRDLVLSADGKTAVIKDLRRDYVEEAMERGSVMLYEMKDDEVVRCTPCRLETLKSIPC